MKTFGKYSEAALSRLNHNGNIIDVQPGSVTRQKTALEGRRRLCSGRPVKLPLDENSSKKNTS